MLCARRSLLALLVGLVVPRIEMAAVIVDQVAAGSAAARAGLAPGDVLVSWSRSTHTGDLMSPFDITFLEIEEVPRGGVELKGRRGDTRRTWTLSPDPWRMQTSPDMASTVRHAFADGMELYEKGRSTEALSRFRDAASPATAEQKIWISSQIASKAAALRLWQETDTEYAMALAGAPASYVAALLYRDWAATSVARSDWTGADQRFQSAIAALQSVPEAKLFRASILYEIGRYYGNRQEYLDSRRYFGDALRIQESEAPESLPMAASLQGIANTHLDTNELDAAEAPMRRALAIREKLAPGTMELARSLHGVARLAQERGDAREAEQFYNRSLAISSEIAPEGAEWALTMNNLGNLVRERDPALAEEYGKKALSARERLAPDSLPVAQTLNGLSTIAQLRGDLIRAEDYLRRSLAIKEKLAPDSDSVAAAYENLGLLEKARGELTIAETYFSRALAIYRKHSSDSLGEASTLDNLGAMYQDAGDLTKAEFYIRQSIDIRTKHDQTDANAIYNLGTIFQRRGELEPAEKQYRAAFAVFDKVAPGGLSSAEILHSLGDLAWQRKDLDAAGKYWRDALSIREKWAPGTAELAYTLDALALLARKNGQSEIAADYFRRAIDAVEVRDLHFGGDQVTRAQVRSEENDYYSEFVDLLLSQNQPEAAFEILERSRARLLLRMLAERDLVMGDVPREVERDRRENAAEYDRTLAQIAQLTRGSNPAELEKLEVKLRENSARRAVIVDRLRAQSPRFASLRYPEPLGAKDIAELLDPGTVLLSYSVRKSGSTLFVVLPGKSTIMTFAIPSGEAVLRPLISTFRRTIQAHGPDSAREAQIEGRLLYHLLIEPAESAIAPFDRILLIPDGPLHTLPFAALPRADGTYLVQWKPLHMALSATLDALQRKQQSNGETKSAAGSVVIFADPDSTEPVKNQTPPPELGQTLREGNARSALPFSRTEAIAISRIYGDRAVVYLGPDATEERAKSIHGDVRYIHFAVHGILDERFPLNSALVLRSPSGKSPAGENGLLQAWEFFEQVRWDADLVGLSACESGLGAELGGEGLMGLTRAIQYAGARSVMASLWSVDDRRTAEFMEKFYTNLHNGETKDEALRKAQIDFIKSPLTSRPVNWAAFTLTGAWR